MYHCHLFSQKCTYGAVRFKGQPSNSLLRDRSPRLVNSRVKDPTQSEGVLARVFQVYPNKNSRGSPICVAQMYPFKEPHVFASLGSASLLFGRTKSKE